MLDYGIGVLGITPIGKAVGTGIRLGDNLIGAAVKVAGTGAENAANGLKLNKIRQKARIALMLSMTVFILLFVLKNEFTIFIRKDCFVE